MVGPKLHSLVTVAGKITQNKTLTIKENASEKGLYHDKLVFSEDERN